MPLQVEISRRNRLVQNAKKIPALIMDHNTKEQKEQRSRISNGDIPAQARPKLFSLSLK